MTVYRMKWDYRFLFGKYKGRRVDEIAKDIYGKTYIVWAYYNKEDIDFDDTILEALGVEKIDKPGVAPAMYDKWMEKCPDRDAIETYKNHVAMGKASASRAYFKRAQRAVDVRVFSRDSREFSKGSMAWKNQGH